MDMGLAPLRRPSHSSMTRSSSSSTVAVAGRLPGLPASSPSPENGRFDPALGAGGGGALALAGTVMQATFRNPLASPDIIGTAAGAAFGGALAIVFGWADLGVVVTPLLALLGCISPRT